MLEMVPRTLMTEDMQQAAAAQGIPSFTIFFLSHLHMVAAAMLLVMIAVLIAAIGLLKRKNWARIAFVWIMALGILYNAASVALPLYFFSTFGHRFEAASGNAPESFAFIRNTAVIFAGVMALVLTVLFGWIIKRLLSPRTRAEFGVGQVL